MKVTFLGTGTSQGVPVIACDCTVCSSKDEKDKRLRCSILIELDKYSIVIDAGPDFRQQMLRASVDKVDAILFTHSHKDHVAGLDDVRAYNYKWKSDMNVYCTDYVSEALNREFPYIFSDVRYPGVPRVNINIIKNKEFKINNISILPIQALHYKMQVFGYRIRDFVYLTDVSSISKQEKKKMLNANIIVLDALRKESHISHFSLDEAVELLNELKPRKAYLTHISHYMGLHEDINQELPDFIRLSYDGLILEDI
jgi:phosphoribosyl 1,2-cyclic phosphate phosphodiesterase